MQHSANYNLNLYESGDPVLAESFNANTRTIDGELAKCLHGTSFSYTGDGTQARTFSFPTKPLVVFFKDGDVTVKRDGFTQWGSPYVHIFFLTDYSAKHQLLPVTWTENAENHTWDMTVRSSGNTEVSDPFNISGKQYTCTAILE